MSEGEKATTMSVINFDQHHLLCNLLSSQIDKQESIGKQENGCEAVVGAFNFKSPVLLLLIFFRSCRRLLPSYMISRLDDAHNQAQQACRLNQRGRLCKAAKIKHFPQPQPKGSGVKTTPVDSRKKEVHFRLLRTFWRVASVSVSSPSPSPATLSMPRRFHVE
ncbi:hypothetical protein HPP92_028902 [Vanilla planifolia]|uniref:Uncharacterized protein n=1 Tax=Vanilla planifolia TaxID=51239 RepID=A0A835U3D3_VANPL|nr:hypothetical protein HPP92_028902 [Vanilla planifolia]KAG0446305.1 hypothetical protein HPP92_028892 [Vanilla planifolia]